MGISAIDLNCDMGESFGRYSLGFDAQMMPLITSANVACGFHAGDPHVMRRTAALAREYGVAVGAHPGLPDLLGFGRRAMSVTPSELRDYFTYQIAALRGFASLQHVKMHGALFDMALSDRSLLSAMCEATFAAGPELIWLCPAGAAAVPAREAGLKVAEEFYADRAYHPDLRLVSRRTPGALIEHPEAVTERLERLLETGTLRTIEGQAIEVRFDSICVHGDTPGAVEIARAVRRVCEAKGVALQPLGALAS
jgi:UPF0271 protein